MIRSMELRDLARIIELESNLFSHPWTEEAFVYELTQNPFSYYWVMERDECVIAYCGAWLSGDQAQITTLGVDTHFQGNGNAKELIQKLFDECDLQGIPRISLEVRVSNDNAIGLYERMGFKKVAVRKDYYEYPHEDAYLMVMERNNHENSSD